MMRLRLLNSAFFGLGLMMGASHLIYPSKSTVVCFDRQKIQGQWIRQLAMHKATDRQVAQLSRQFKITLQKILQDYSKKHRVLIVDRRWLLAGGSDVTSLIAAQLAQAMRASS